MEHPVRFLWTLPNTLLGVVAGAFTFQRPRVVEGALVFDRRARGLTAVMREFDRTAMTVGYVIVSSEPVEGTLLRHEQHHIRQYERWGPFFIPLYLVLSIAYGYRRHPMELAAMRAAEEVA
jgi:hypothetical protein